MPFIKVATENSAEIELHYNDHGTGKPIVLIHGYPLDGNSGSARSARCWPRGIAPSATTGAGSGAPASRRRDMTYGWALSQPVRKVFYNLTITGLSVAVALVMGTIEVGGLISSELDLSGSFWNWFENVDLNLLGFVIVAMFIATWVIALLVWRLGRIEERWSKHLEGASSPGAPRC